MLNCASVRLISFLLDKTSVKYLSPSFETAEDFTFGKFACLQSDFDK